MPLIPTAYLMLAQMVYHAVSVCTNSPYTSLIESEIARLERLDLSHHDYINATANAYTVQRSCGRMPVNEHTPYNYRTLCPWEYERDRDDNRFPPVLNIARCRCNTCFDNYQCKPVLYSIPVLIKQCTDGIIHWVRKSHLLSVACTCSRPPIRHVRKRLSHMLGLDDEIEY